MTLYKINYLIDLYYFFKKNKILFFSSKRLHMAIIFDRKDYFNLNAKYKKIKLIDCVPKKIEVYSSYRISKLTMK